MSELLEKYNDYIRLNNCRAEYLLFNGLTIDFTYKKENFIHLIGLHKLKDIEIIQLYNDKKNKSVNARYIINRIRKEKFTDREIKKSYFYDRIKSRYENFSYENLTSLTYTDAIINFDSTMINSKLNSKYLLIEETSESEFNHLGIALDSKTKQLYLETFFHHDSEMYIKGQKQVKVKSFTLYNSKNEVIVSDFFDK